MLRNANREIDLLSARAPNAPEEEREALDEEETRLRAMRAKLSRAIAEAEQEDASD